MVKATTVKKGTTKKTTNKKRTHMDNLVSGFKNGQPSPEAKKAGWARKKQKEKMLNKILEYCDMDIDKFNKMIEAVDERLGFGEEGNKKEGDKNNKVKLTVGDYAMANYVRGVMKGKFAIDRMDRHIAKAPQEQIVTNLNVEVELDDKQNERVKELFNRNYDD